MRTLGKPPFNSKVIFRPSLAKPTEFQSTAQPRDRTSFQYNEIVELCDGICLWLVFQDFFDTFVQHMPGKGIRTRARKKIF